MKESIKERIRNSVAVKERKANPIREMVRKGKAVVPITDRDSCSSMDDDSQPSKRRKLSPSDELVCPITLDLPFDPVTAEDGRVYERSAIL
eukprot:CAMPEP_0198281798 /NCGR_PEP_ID=MMETSP1449-20131203/1671_1 /TAXON_ID=420275 /ORGANISM="Attheya septentrionalis, Strain CCMP2084" /LENGTH=90 /DNA_ID=CAMNT_0043977717 /DNA_START=9 /DNA_END=277 /DNA_ORIENTATION=+